MINPIYEAISQNKRLTLLCFNGINVLENKDKDK